MQACDTNVMFVGSEKSGKKKLIEKLNYQFKFGIFNSVDQEELTFRKENWKNSQTDKSFNLWSFKGDKKVFNFLFN